MLNSRGASDEKVTCSVLFGLLTSCPFQVLMKTFLHAVSGRKVVTKRSQKTLYLVSLLFCFAISFDLPHFYVYFSSSIS